VEVLYAGVEPSPPAAPVEIAATGAVIGIVGRLQPWKGQHHVIGAAALLRARGHDVHVLIVGGTAFGLSPEYPAQLRSLVAAAGLEEHVTFADQVDDVSAYLAAMDVVVNASAPEPFGLVILEAMAAERPVVAFAAGGPVEIIEDGVTGRLVSPFTAEALAESLEALVADPDLRAAMGRAGRERALTAFRPEATAERTAELLADVVS
jgi:glycosyltransferase involved in cell wall biosynthesis